MIKINLTLSIPKFITLLFLLLLCSNISFAQRFLQIETINDPSTIKLVEGERFEYKIFQSDEWLSGKIQKLMVQENTIVFPDALVSIDQISHIRRYRPIASYLGKGLMTFGAGWFVFGGLAAASGNYQFGTDTFVIGGTALAAGWLIQKFFYKRTLLIGKKYRLRLIDTSID